MSKFTPGPWQAWPTHNGGDTPYVETTPHVPRDTPHRRICQMTLHAKAGIYPTPQEEDYANAHLMAASPALLEAAVAALEILDGWDKDGLMDQPEEFAARDQLRAAIAQATGGEEG